MDTDLDYSVLIVVDAIDSATEGEDTVYNNELSPEMAAFRANVAEVVELAHENEIPVIFCNDAHIEGLDQELELWGPHGIKGRTRIFPEIEVEDCDLIIPKRRYSAFFQTDLELTLSEIGADTLIVVGCDTNVCVLHTLADAFYRNFKTVVVEDATITFLGVGTQEGAIDLFGKCYGSEIVSVEELKSTLA